MSNEKVEFELGFIDSPDAGRQLKALADQVEKTQQKMSASVKAFSDDMQASIKQMTTASNQASTGSSGGKGFIDSAKASAAEAMKSFQLVLDKYNMNQKAMRDISELTNKQIIDMHRKSVDAMSRTWQSSIDSHRSASEQLSAITESAGKSFGDAFTRSNAKASSLRSTFGTLASESLNAADGVARLSRGVALFAGGSSDNMEKVLRTIMKIQGAMDLIQGGSNLFGSVKNRLIPAGSNFMAALGGTTSGRAARGFELAAARGVGGFASSAAGGAMTSATSAAASGGGRGIMNYAIGSAVAQGAMRYGGRAIAAGRGLASGVGRVASAIPGRIGTMGARIRAALGPQTAGLVGGSPLSGSYATYSGGAARRAGLMSGGRALAGRAVGAVGRAAGAAIGAPAALPIAATAFAGTSALASADWLNSSSSEGGSMAGNFFNRKFTVGGFADKGGQTIAKLADSFNNLIGTVLGASRSFDLLGNKQTEYARRLTQLAKINEARQDAQRSAAIYQAGEEKRLDGSLRQSQDAYLQSQITGTGPVNAFAMRANVSMSRFRASQAAARNRIGMGPRERAFQDQRQKEADFFDRRARRRRQFAMDEARGSVDDAESRRAEAQEVLDRNNGMSAEEMIEYNRQAEIFDQETKNAQRLNAEYRSSTNQNMNRFERSVTGEGAGPGSRRSSAGEDTVDRYGFGTLNNLNRTMGASTAMMGAGGLALSLGQMLGLTTREVEYEEKETKAQADDAAGKANEAAEKMRQMESQYGITGGFSQREIDEAADAQQTMIDANEEYIASQERLKGVMQRTGKELIEQHRQTREEIEKNIIALEREKIANIERYEAGKRSMGTMGEAERGEYMIALRKLDSGQMGDLSNQEIQMLQSGGMLNASATATLEQEQERRFEANLSAADKGIVDRQQNVTAENKAIDTEIGNQDRAMEQQNEQMINDLDKMEMSGGGDPTLKIVDGTNFQIQLTENMDALTARAVDQIMDAMEVRNELLKNQITAEVTAQLAQADSANQQARTAMQNSTN